MGWFMALGLPHHTMYIDVQVVPSGFESHDIYVRTLIHAPNGSSNCGNLRVPNNAKKNNMKQKTIPVSWCAVYSGKSKRVGHHDQT
jgi:hypothetical protein